MLSGRYGPYVTDGTLNASLPKGVEPAEITLPEAVDLLRRRAERVKAKKAARGRKSPARKKKAAGKKAAAKKAAKKKAAKKKTARKVSRKPDAG